MLYALCALRYAIGSGIRLNRMSFCIYIPHSAIRIWQAPEQILRGFEYIKFDVD